MPGRLLDDCRREISSRLALQPGDVEPLSLARARSRWPEYRRCVQALDDCLRGFGLQDALVDADQALMACRGAPLHHDGDQYGSAVFCNLFVSEDRGLDVLFPLAGLRIALERGTALVFDTCQPHAVIPRASSVFDPADFTSGRDLDQLFLTWELPVEAAQVSRALGIRFDIDPLAASVLDREQLWFDGAPMAL